MFETINDLLAMPGIKRAMEFSFVAKHQEQFKLFLSTFYLKALNKWSKWLKHFLSLRTLILINLIIISYYGGKTNAVSISQWINVISEIHIWFGPMIVINIIYLLGRYIRKVLEFLLYLMIVILIFYLVYQILVWLYDKLFGTYTTVVKNVKIE